MFGIPVTPTPVDPGRSNSRRNTSVASAAVTHVADPALNAIIPANAHSLLPRAQACPSAAIAPLQAMTAGRRKRNHSEISPGFEPVGLVADSAQPSSILNETGVPERAPLAQRMLVMFRRHLMDIATEANGESSTASDAMARAVQQPFAGLEPAQCVGELYDILANRSVAENVVFGVGLLIDLGHVALPDRFDVLYKVVERSARLPPQDWLCVLHFAAAVIPALPPQARMHGLALLAAVATSLPQRDSAEVLASTARTLPTISPYDDGRAQRKATDWLLDLPPAARAEAAPLIVAAVRYMPSLARPEALANLIDAGHGMRHTLQLTAMVPYLMDTFLDQPALLARIGDRAMASLPAPERLTVLNYMVATAVTQLPTQTMASTLQAILGLDRQLGLEHESEFFSITAARLVERAREVEKNLRQSPFSYESLTAFEQLVAVYPLIQGPARWALLRSLLYVVKAARQTACLMEQDCRSVALQGECLIEWEMLRGVLSPPEVAFCAERLALRETVPGRPSAPGF